MIMGVLLICFILGVFCVDGVLCVQCTAFESTFSSKTVTFTCQEKCCSSSYSQQCCHIDPVDGWLIAIAVIISLLILGCCCGILVLIIKSCTKTGYKGRVISPLPSYTMPSPPAYSPYNTSPPAYTASPVSANATGQTRDTTMPMQDSGHRSTQEVYGSSSTAQLPSVVAFPPVSTSGVPPVSSTATADVDSSGPTSGVSPASTTTTTSVFSSSEPIPGVPPASTVARTEGPASGGSPALSAAVSLPASDMLPSQSVLSVPPADTVPTV